MMSSENPAQEQAGGEKPRDLSVRADHTLALGEADFAFRVVSGEALFLPQTLVDFMEEFGLATATEFVCYVQTYPSSLSERFNWTVGQVMAALDQLTEALKEHVDFPPEVDPQGFGFGALLPEDEGPTQAHK